VETILELLLLYASDFERIMGYNLYDCNCESCPNAPTMIRACLSSYLACKRWGSVIDRSRHDRLGRTRLRNG
jgi:hypothetical protein